MTSIEMIEIIMKQSNTSLSDIAEYGDFGTKENVYQMLKRQDLKVGTFVRMLEVMGFQLVAQSEENSEEFVVDYDL